MSSSVFRASTGALAVAAALSLAACGSSGSSSSTSSSSVPKLTTTSSAPATTSSAATTASSTAAASGTAGSYTLADLKKHATATSCWAAVDKNVYDLTQWIPNHPGGADRIKALCGTDATAAFRGEHRNEPEPNQTLAKFKIGTFAG